MASYSRNCRKNTKRYRKKVKQCKYKKPARKLETIMKVLFVLFFIVVVVSFEIDSKAAGYVIKTGLITFFLLFLVLFFLSSSERKQCKYVDDDMFFDSSFGDYYEKIGPDLSKISLAIALEGPYTDDPVANAIGIALRSDNFGFNSFEKTW